MLMSEHASPPGCLTISCTVLRDRDASSQHCVEADEAINVGSIDQTGGNPFLNIKTLVQTGLACKAEAIHPGYGYLSENAHFADAVRAAGMIFIGPTSQAMLTLGDKRQAKEYLREHEPSIPLIPGYSGPLSVDTDELERQAAEIGFPIMVKASAGGGGRGMRIVRDSTSLREEVASAQSEAQRSFGSGDCILEKYIASGKHVEVQILGDSAGQVISLWERDCSVQRRHQKIVEETPCTWLTREQRDRLCAAAVRIGQLLRYEGAGTVEFMLDLATGGFYFLEVNARLQVEHPITEECTGLDIVALQLYVACGGRLRSLRQLDTIQQNGHAIECRLCTEDPDQNFVPQHGLIRLWEPSPQYEGDRDVRFETAVRSGSTVSIHFDSMIAKIVVWAPTRALAIGKMVQVLARSACLGVRTNQLFLQQCLTHPTFNKGDYTTSFIPAHLESLLARHPQGTLDPQLLNVKLPLIAPLFLRSFRARHRKAEARSLFRSIRPGFRNQVFDRVNIPSDIVTRYDTGANCENQAWICLWKYERTTSCTIGSIPTAPAPANEAHPRSAAVQATELYNALSTSIDTGDLPRNDKADILVHSLRTQTVHESTAPPWLVGQMIVSINDQLLEVRLATDDLYDSRSDVDIGAARRVYCHSPMLGTYVEYRCYSVLSFFESQRASATGQDGGLSQGSIIASMPCKVLRMLKRNGDAVNTGEILMVVESMKMEINISASQDGVFQSSLVEGDGVDQGTILCSLGNQEESGSRPGPSDSSLKAGKSAGT